MDSRSRLAAWRHHQTREGFEVVFADGADTGPRFDGTTTAVQDGQPWGIAYDLEASVLTNAFPVARQGLAPGEAADAPAVYVRTGSLQVKRLEQRYERRSGGDGDPEAQRYGYEAPAFGVRCELVYDAAGLVRDYPGLAVRVA